MTRTTKAPVEKMSSKMERAASTTDMNEIRHILKHAQQFDTFVVGALALNKRLQHHDRFAREMQHRILNSRFAKKEYHYMAARDIATITQDKGVQIKIIHIDDWVVRQNLARSEHLLPELQPRLARHANHGEVKLALLERKDLQMGVRHKLLTNLTEGEIRKIVKNIDHFDVQVVAGLMSNKRMQHHDEFSTEMQQAILDSRFAKKEHNYAAAREIAKVARDKGVQSRILYGKDERSQQSLAKNSHLIPELQRELVHNALSMDVKILLYHRTDILSNVKKGLLSDPHFATKVTKGMHPQEGLLRTTQHHPHTGGINLRAIAD